MSERKSAVINFVRSHSRFFWVAALIGGIWYYRTHQYQFEALFEKAQALKEAEPPEGKHRKALGEFEQSYYNK